MLDRAVTRIALPSSQSGLTLNWAIGPAGRPLTSQDYQLVSHASNAMAQRPLSPVHLRRKLVAGGDRFSWIRRSRIAADGWEQPEVPLDEPQERYRVTILDASRTVVLTETLDVPFLELTHATRLAALGSMSASFTVAVAQLRSNGAEGAPASLTVNP